MVMHSQDPPDSRRPKTKLVLKSNDLVKLGYASFLKFMAFGQSQSGHSYTICIKQTNIKLKIQYNSPVLPNTTQTLPASCSVFVETFFLLRLREKNVTSYFYTYFQEM